MVCAYDDIWHASLKLLKKGEGSPFDRLDCKEAVCVAATQKHCVVVQDRALVYDTHGISEEWHNGQESFKHVSFLTFSLS